jgi:hypothetical protein
MKHDVHYLLYYLIMHDSGFCAVLSQLEVNENISTLQKRERERKERELTIRHYKPGWSLCNFSTLMVTPMSLYDMEGQLMRNHTHSKTHNKRRQIHDKILQTVFKKNSKRETRFWSPPYGVLLHPDGWNTWYHTVTWHLRARIMEPEEIVCCMVTASKQYMTTGFYGNRHKHNNRGTVGNGYITRTSERLWEAVESQLPSWAVAAMTQLWEGRRPATKWPEEDTVGIGYQAMSGEDTAHWRLHVSCSEQSA